MMLVYYSEQELMNMINLSCLKPSVLSENEAAMEIIVDSWKKFTGTTWDNAQKPIWYYSNIEAVVQDLGWDLSKWKVEIARKVMDVLVDNFFIINIGQWAKSQKHQPLSDKSIAMCKCHILSKLKERYEKLCLRYPENRDILKCEYRYIMYCLVHNINIKRMHYMLGI